MSDKLRPWFNVPDGWKDDREDGFPAQIKAEGEDGEFLWYVPYDEYERNLNEMADHIDCLRRLCADLYHDLEREDKPHRLTDLPERLRAYEDRMYEQGVLGI